MRRVAGEPLEHLLGHVDLDGLRVVVTPGVFVPRQRSLLLVAAAVAARVPAAEVWACDLDPVAVACARRNLPPERVLQGDLYAALPARLRGSFDVVVANAPYVPTEAIATMPPEAREHEPRTALDGGPDGAALHRRVAAGARDWLRPGGSLLVETSRSQSSLTLAACEDAGLAAYVLRDDERDATAVVGTAP